MCFTREGWFIYLATACVATVIFSIAFDPSVPGVHCPLVLTIAILTGSHHEERLELSTDKSAFYSLAERDIFLCTGTSHKLSVLFSAHHTFSGRFMISLRKACRLCDAPNAHMGFSHSAPSGQVDSTNSGSIGHLCRCQSTTPGCNIATFSTVVNPAFIWKCVCGEKMLGIFIGERERERCRFSHQPRSTLGRSQRSLPPLQPRLV